MSHELPHIAFSLGDPAGTGPEVLLKALSDERLLELMVPIVHAEKRTLLGMAKRLGMLEPALLTLRKDEKPRPGKIWIRPVWEEEYAPQPGQPEPEGAHKAYASLQSALEEVRSGGSHALVTLPVDKSRIATVAPGFTGHTGMLGKALQSDPLMILCSESLRVALVTEHIPLEQVSAQLSTARILSKIQKLNEALRSDFGLGRGKIAVLGLNPHNGDGGLMGNQETEVIQPAIAAARASGILVFGPYAADGFFGSGAYAEFDAVLAQYHDQGLIPFKALNFESGVNYTAGLPLVRTSPDHGTAFGIAGKGEASAQSLLESMYLAIDVLRNRSAHNLASAAPLPFGKKGKKDR
ncbi:4-hydroxythreonine-4-phosphate dehydrogenase PdxA [bacterium]|nr:4-hydroxythreonine-4-phosphate dehydrogenase PdxA [bacterium]